MAIAAHDSLEKRIALAPHRMLYFKAFDVGLRAIKALRIVAPQLCSPPFEPPRALDGIGIAHALVSGVT